MYIEFKKRYYCKQLSAILLSMFFAIFAKVNAAPPDRPLTPKQWSQLCGNGSWMIFPESIPGGKHNKKMSVPLTSTTLKSLKSIGIKGGRLQISDSTGVAIDPETGLLKKNILEAINKSVDKVLSAGFTVMMQVHFELKKEERMALLLSDRRGEKWLKDHKIDSEEERFKRMRHMMIINVADSLKRWEQLCKLMANKSHRLAMCPVVECHMFDDWLQYRKKLNIDNEIPWLPKGADKLQAYRAYLDQCVRIFRKYNPTRIIGLKGYVSSRNHGVPLAAEKLYWSKAQKKKMMKKLKKSGQDVSADTLLPNAFDELKWPIGGDPAPGSGKPIYYMAILSASSPYGPWWDWNKNTQFTNAQIIKGASLRFEFIDKWRKKYGIEVFSDHWLPTRHTEGVDYDRMPDKLKKRFKRQVASGKLPPLLTREQCAKSVEWNYRLYRKYKIPNSGPRPDFFLHEDGTLKTDDKEGLMWINAARQGNGLPPLKPKAK